MFENTDSVSPEPRGRSPAGSVTSNGDGHTLNKVRTSFVPVEPINPSVAQTTSKERNSDAAPAEELDRKGSFSSSVKQELASIVGDKAENSSDIAGQKQPTPAKGLAVSTAIEDTPGSAITPKKEQADDLDKQVNDLADGLRQMSLPSGEVPSGHPDKVTSAIEDGDEHVAMKPSDPKEKEAVSGGAALPPPAEPLPNLSTHSQLEATSSPAPNAVAPPNSMTKGLEATPSKAMQNGHPADVGSKKSTSPTKSSPKKSKPTTIHAQPVSAARKSSPKKNVPASSTAAALRSPITPTTHTNSRIQATPPSTKTVAMMNGTPPSTNGATVANGTSPASGKAATKSSNNKPPRTSLTAPTAASLSKVTKPRLSSSSATSTVSKKPTSSPPASTTAAVRVSSHLTAATASSAAKHSAAPTAAATSSAASNIARKPSTLRRDPAAAPRLTKPTASNAEKAVRPPSLSKQNGIKRPESRSSRPDTAPAPTRKETTKLAAPGFLERMTRPTASSSSKVHEKV